MREPLSPLRPALGAGLGANKESLTQPLAAAGVCRDVWESRFGAVLIEVRGDEVFVNGKSVEPVRTEEQGAVLPTRSTRPSDRP